MGTLASGSIDLNSLQVAGKPNKYITDINNRGITIHPELISANSYYTIIDGNGLKINKVLNNTIDYINDSTIANFGADGIILGNNNGTQAYMLADYHSLQLIDKEGSSFFYVSDLRDKNDNWQATLTETFYGDGNTSTFTVRFDVSAEISASVDSEPTNTATRVYRNYTFANAPAAGNKVTIVYKSLSVNLKAYSLGTRGNAPKGPYSVVEGRWGNASGYCSHAEGSDGNATAPYSHVEGFSMKASGHCAHAEGTNGTASGDYSHAEGYRPTASGNASHAEGYSAIASGNYSHAEGYSANAHGDYSHAEGSGTKAFPYGSHAEGSVTTANGVYSHAEGGHTLTGSQSYSTSYGQYAHAEGYYTVAKANYSHAQNYYTTANYEMQTAIGSFNDNQSDTAFEIGNGTGTDARSNALTVGWNGNVKASGNITDGTGNILSAKANSANMFYITNVTPSGYNFDPNQYRSLSSSNITIYSGYTPIIVQARCTNKSGLHVFNYSISGTTLNYEVVNRTSSQVSDANFAFRILHIRNELIG